jgi:uncharacterized protein
VHTINWFEIGTDDQAATERFYGDLFGWTFADDNDSRSIDGSPYRVVTTPEGGIGGGVNRTGGQTPNYAVFYVMVPDAADTCRRAEAAGGKVLRAPSTDPGGLTFAHIVDPTGNHIGVYTPPTRH